MGKIIWITGAGSGVGKAMSLAYAENNNTLILSGRSEESLNEVENELKAKACQYHILVLDVSDENAIEPAVKQLIDLHGRIDILINSAGISQRSLISETSNEVGRKIMDVNFYGTVHLTKAVLPYMLKANSGDIVAISSAAGKFGFPRRSYYSASKHALHGFFDTLNLELHKTNINVLLVCPGRINTNISMKALTGDGQVFNKLDHRLQSGISADKCAQIIKRAIRKRKKEVYMGGREVILIYIKRYAPFLYRYIAARAKAY